MSEKQSLRHYLSEAIEEMHFTYALEVDCDQKIITIDGEPPQGLPELKEGDILTKKLPFLENMVSCNKHQQELLTLPFVSIGTSAPIHVNIIPLKNKNTGILLIDASEDYAQRQGDQQLRHELELSHAIQKKMLNQLQAARHNIEEKNRLLEHANKAKSLFIANMSHEFRSPLTSIMGYTDLLKRVVSEIPQTSEYIDAIERGSRHLLLMIDNLLDQARIEVGELDLLPQPSDVENLLREALSSLKPLAARKKLKLSYEIIDAAPGDVLIDSLRLRQVMLNLINNAIKYTSAGSVTCTSDWKNNWLEMTVADTGPGIPEEALEKIFEPFYRVDNPNTTKQQGTGLGLAISKNLIERMGGNLTCKPGSNGGTVFTVSMPAISINEEQPDTELDTEAPVILIAEDDPDIRMLIEINLAQIGYSVITCTNGEDAIIITKNENPDIVLIDMNMPVVSGLEAVEVIRKDGFKGPIIALTASSFRNSALDAGCSDYVAKPLNMNDLYTTLATYHKSTI